MMSDVWLLRIGIIVAGLALLLAIVLFSRPRKGEQGRRTGAEPRGGTPRRDPSFAAPDTGTPPPPHDTAPPPDTAGLTPPPADAALGKRVSEEFDRIVTLYIAARAGQHLHGPDIAVAAERAGLVFGHMDVFHRLVDGRPERGPIFSVANVLKPGGFDMADIQNVRTPAVAFFLTLPAPVPALDAWDSMLPAAERMTELLDGVLLDESRNALGRQRIQHIREELRTYDRQHEIQTPRW